MKIWQSFRVIFLGAFLSFGIGQYTLATEYTDDIAIADRKVILEQYEEAKEIYQNIIDSAEPSVVVAYAHYKLGTLYKKQHDPAKAKMEYQKGLTSLKDAGQTNHQIARHLEQALHADK